MINGETAPANNINAPAIKTPTELADKYTFIQELGRGTQGHVYKAVRKSNQEYVAIKQLRIDSIQSWKEYDLFMREAETLKSLNIPGVVKFVEALQFLDIEHPAAYIVQEYIPGRSLGEMMRSNYRFSTQQIFKFAIKLLTILKELHHHDPPIIHRDIKPSNLLFVPQETGDDFDLYLIDFGAVANPHVQSGGSTVAGTFGYMPPEQLMGKPSPASDIYALGATIAYMLSGVEPSSMQVSDFRLIIEPHLEAIPKRVVVTLRQMLAPNISQRLCDYEELILRFKQYAINLFTISQSDDPNCSKIDINEKLKEVSTYWQEGNTEIWDMLSDCTPRVIPTLYLSLNTNAMPEMFSINELLYNMRSENARFVFSCYLGFTIIISIVILSAMIFIIYNTYQPLHPFLSICITAPILLVSLPFIYGAIRSAKATYRLRPSVLREELLDPGNECLGRIKYYYKKSYLNKKAYQKVFRSGQKMIATVVEVSYKKVEPLLVEEYTFSNDKNDNDHSEQEVIHVGYCHQPAAFTIRYKFNPPDDSSPYDLVHEITTYSDCEDKLKPGDLIPILYYINPDNNREVWSTPFPLPQTDFWNYDNIVGFSCDRRLKNSLETKT